MTHIDLRSVKACPLCGTSEANDYPPAPRNLYSEKLAGLLGIAESRLLDTVSNVQCQSCELIYKRQWFQPETLGALFSDCVPLHPKGWDAVSGRFSADNFRREALQYKEALDQQDEALIARYRRALRSIIDSIRDQSESARLGRLREAVEEGDVDSLLAQHEWLTEQMDEAAPYSRFAGFSSPDLWRYMEERAGSIHSYGEAGCPLWGLLWHADEKDVTAIFVQRDEPNYWGNGCRVDGQSCLKALLGQSGIRARQWHDIWNARLDVFGLFQYLDHLEQPDQFITDAAQRADSLAIILDDVNEPPAVQHFTGWPETAIETLAKRHGFHVHSDFEAIRASGNHLYLLVRDQSATTA